jgi:hypothetical protein
MLFQKAGKHNFVCENLRFHPDANVTVLQFIADFIYMHSLKPSHAELIRKQFHCGYCYHFASMLKNSFKRGNVCVCGSIGHFVWCDDNGIPYDIEGVNETECECYIPESYIPEDLVEDFIHIPGKPTSSTCERVQELVKSYKNCQQNKIGGQDDEQEDS